jgi:hypothetical protein
MFRFNGEPAIGLAISMAQGGNNLTFGEAVAHKMEQIIAKLSIGIEAHLVADQPVVVEEAVGGFTKALWEAIAIVLAVSFVSLGLRAGVVVRQCRPVVHYLAVQPLADPCRRVIPNSRSPPIHDSPVERARFQLSAPLAKASDGPVEHASPLQRT